MSFPTSQQRRGVTLIELIVTVAILGVILAVATLSLAGEKRSGAIVRSGARMRTQMLALRSAAVTSGVAQTAALADSNGAMLLATALPDGRLVTDSRQRAIAGSTGAAGRTAGEADAR